jgi:transposase-like protein
MHFSKEEKAMRLEDWRLSGKSPWAYAKQNGMIPQTFSRWVKEQADDSRGFVQLPTAPIAPPETPRILIEKGELRIHLPLGIAAEELRMIISVLGGEV